MTLRAQALSSIHWFINHSKLMSPTHVGLIVKERYTMQIIKFHYLCYKFQQSSMQNITSRSKTRFLKTTSLCLNLRQRPNPPRGRSTVVLCDQARGHRRFFGASSMDGVTRFPLSPSCSLVIQRGDLTKWSVDGFSDAIVNPANERMIGGGGADGAIHRAAGPDLLQACIRIPEVRHGVRCPTGEARITPGFRLPVAHVVLTVGPMYKRNSNAEALLRNAYRNSLRLAKENGIQYIAFPAISCGVYGYPYEEAATVAISTIKEFADDFKEVHFVHFLEEVYFVWLNKANELLNA